MTWKVWRDGDSEWIYFDEHIDCLIKPAYERGGLHGRCFMWRLWEGHVFLQEGFCPTNDESRYAAWSWYVDWCAEHCPARLEYL